MPIFYYLTHALRHIPYCWEPVTRFIQLDAQELKMYEKGRIITWLQFSSSSQMKHGAKGFDHRNTKFVIQSLKGRSISKFSNYEAQEEEVLFPPFTRLLILDKRPLGDNKTEIRARELELGMGSEMPLLWVDDNVLKANFEMKGHMERAQMARKQEIAFILKPSTNLALHYLFSPFGWRFFREGSTLHVISDMQRPEEEDGDKAGAKLMKVLDDMDFPGRALIFTSSTGAASTKLYSEGVRRPVQEVSGSQRVERGTVGVTSSSKCALQFLCFD